MAKLVGIERMREILEALKKAPEQIMPYLGRAMTFSTRHIQGQVAEYPPATAANRPGRKNAAGREMGYYERGRGWWYPTRTGYKLAGGGTSQMLGRSWDSSVVKGRDYVLGIVGNNATYAEFVQGSKQAHFHAERGWKTLDKAVEESAEKIDEFFSAALDDYLKSIE